MSIYLFTYFTYIKGMLYTVGDHIDLSHLNTPQQRERRLALSEHVRALPDKMIPGTKVSFLRMATGLIVMSVAEPPMILSVGIA